MKRFIRPSFANEGNSEPCPDPNAVRKPCGVPTHCLPACDEPNPPLCENKECVKNACECKPGFVFDFDYLYCIPISDCEKTELPLKEAEEESKLVRNKKIFETLNSKRRKSRGKQ
ncbi:hypothetical protein Aduo_015055 [Ancylostoma duodenale]